MRSSVGKAENPKPMKAHHAAPRAFRRFEYALPLRGHYELIDIRIEPAPRALKVHPAGMFKRAVLTKIGVPEVQQAEAKGPIFERPGYHTNLVKPGDRFQRFQHLFR